MPTFYRVSCRNTFRVFLLVGSALFMAAGCGGGGKSESPKYDFHIPSGHFRGVTYATDAPASGETPLYTVDFNLPISAGYGTNPSNDSNGSYIDDP